VTRGIKPLVAISEAKQKAIAWGFQLIELETKERLPYDFAFHYEGVTTLARVRRLKYAEFWPEQIMRACVQQIRELREAAIMANLAKELWVRGPDRTWHRYRVLPDSIEEVKNSPDRESLAKLKEKNR